MTLVTALIQLTLGNSGITLKMLDGETQKETADSWRWSELY